MSADDRDIARNVARLLLHYPVGQMSDEARREIAYDWLEDLREFSPDIVAEACARWRRQPGSRRPGSGDIRALCIEEQRERRENALALPAPEMSEDEIHQLADAYAQEHGFQCIEAFQRAGHSVVIRIGRGKFRRFDGLEPELPAARPDRVRGFDSVGVAARDYLAGYPSDPAQED